MDRAAFRTESKQVFDDPERGRDAILEGGAVLSGGTTGIVRSAFHAARSGRAWNLRVMNAGRVRWIDPGGPKAG